MKFAHLTHMGPRAALIINEGLTDLKIDFDLDRNYILAGKIEKHRNKNILKNITNYNFIICGNILYIDFFNEHDLWQKVIWYDFEDTCNVLNIKPLSYFKRSIATRDRQLIDLTNIFPIDYCALKSFYVKNNIKNIDVSCLFDKNIWLGDRRKNLLNNLSGKFNNSIIGKTTSSGSIGRNTILKNYDSFYEYLDLLARSKIIFTAFPQDHDGDSRTWEAFASNALVFRDTTYIPNDLENNIHFCEFYALDSDSIQEAIKKAKFYLKNETDRLKISAAGFNHVKNNHMAINRVSYILKSSGINF